MDRRTSIVAYWGKIFLPSKDFEVVPKGEDTPPTISYHGDTIKIHLYDEPISDTYAEKLILTQILFAMMAEMADKSFDDVLDIAERLLEKIDYLKNECFR